MKIGSILVLLIFNVCAQSGQMYLREILELENQGRNQMIRKFGNTLVLATGECNIMTQRENGTLALVYKHPMQHVADTYEPCLWEGFISPQDRNLYLYQLDSIDKVLQIFQMGPQSSLWHNVTQRPLHYWNTTATRILVDYQHTIAYFVGNGTIDIMDISNAKRPALIKTIETEVNNVETIDSVGNYLYMSGWGQGLKRIDMKDGLFKVETVIPGNSTFAMIRTSGAWVSASSLNFNGVPQTVHINTANMNVQHWYPRFSKMIEFLNDNLYLNMVMVNTPRSHQLQLCNMDKPTNVSVIAQLAFTIDTEVFTGARFLEYDSGASIMFMTESGVYSANIVSVHSTALQEYTQRKKKPLGDFKDPLEIVRQLGPLSLVNGTYLQFNSSVLNVTDGSAQLPFAPVLFKLEAINSSGISIEILKESKWIPILLDMDITQKDIDAGNVRLNARLPGKFKLRPRQLGNQLDTLEFEVKILEPPFSALTIAMGVVTVFLVILLICVPCTVLRKGKIVKLPSILQSQTLNDAGTGFSETMIGSSVRTANERNATEIGSTITVVPDEQAGAVVVPGYLEFHEGVHYKRGETITKSGMGAVVFGIPTAEKLVIGGDKIILKLVNEKKVDMELFHQEIAIMQSLHQHDNFARLLGYCEYPMTIIMKYYPLGDLQRYILTEHPFYILPRFASDIAAALRIMHNKGLVHADIKPSNILLDVKPDGRLFCVLTDFGITKIVNSASLAVKAYQAVRIEGWSFAYAAPEVINSKWAEPNLVFFHDVYSYGMVLYYMLCRSRPWALAEKNQ